MVTVSTVFQLRTEFKTNEKMTKCCLLHSAIFEPGKNNITPNYDFDVNYILGQMAPGNAVGKSQSTPTFLQLRMRPI